MMEESKQGKSSVWIIILVVIIVIFSLFVERKEERYLNFVKTTYSVNNFVLWSHF
jgi:preprotein translocase subunit YajC